LICLPDTGRAIAELCRKRLAAQASGLQILEVEEMEEAVRLAYAHTRKGRICLLSPAASSYNRYKDFTQRGEAFKTAVRDLADQSLPLGTAAAFAIDGD
jgi:UDP-N-acetylmuramoylalanine--D-glutamate ligase